MSRVELERLVSTAEQDPNLRTALGHCRSAHELLRSAHALGFGVTRHDLLLARAEHKQELDQLEQQHLQQQDKPPRHRHSGRQGAPGVRSQGRERQHRRHQA